MPNLDLPCTVPDAHALVHPLDAAVASASQPGGSEVSCLHRPSVLPLERIGSSMPHADEICPLGAPLSEVAVSSSEDFASRAPVPFSGLVHQDLWTCSHLPERCWGHECPISVAAPFQCPEADPSAASHAETPVQASSEATHDVARPHSPIRLPPFAQQMMINLPMEFLSNPVRIVQGFLVRTWYLHHVNIPRSLQARQVMLTGPPHLWRPHILTVWSDLLIPGEDITLDLVSPAPPRNWHETNIVFDLILAQGLYTGRVSGLTTISPTITEPSLRMYAIAVSFAADISGQDVITESDAQPHCNRFDCLVFHAFAQLFIDFNPVHRMSNGDSFVIYLSQKQSPASPSGPLLVESTDPAPEPLSGSGDADMTHDASHSHAATLPDNSLPGNDHHPDGPPQTSEYKRVTIYRLDRPSISAWIRWGNFAHLLQDVMAQVQITPSEVVAVHRILVKPVGESSHETSLILQQIGDIPPGSAETRILLDTTFHQQGPVAQSSVVQHFDRKVAKVPNPITRLGLLYIARVANYCETVRDACLVFSNHRLWNMQRQAPQQLLHGAYCRIHIPPARTHGAETCRAVSLVEDCCDPFPTTFAQVYPQMPHHTDVNVRDSHSAFRSSSMHPVPADGFAASGIPKSQHLGDEQQGSPPAFEVPIPSQNAPVLPNVPDWHGFQLELSSLFDEVSITEIPEEGPVAFVTTWFVHHDHAPTCVVGRLVRLSNRPHEWFQLLVAPWIHMLQPFANLAFRLVKPAPVSDIPGFHMIHVILEQGLQQSRYVALLSAVFQGLHGDVTHRRAQSVPTQLSKEVIARILSIQELCRARQCDAWSGRLRFHATRLEPVFSGIGVCLTVDAFRNRFTAAGDFSAGSQPAASSSHLPPRMSFRVDDASLFPFPSSAGEIVECETVVHAPSRLVPELTIIWQHHLMTTTSRPYRFYVETWFCDHDRFPRTNRGREVLLPPNADQWRQALLDKWQDMIDPNVDTYIYVVSPATIGGPSDVLAHVLLAQHQHRGFVSALITTIAPGDDIYDPPRVALKLPSVVDKGLLIQESGLFMFCPPFLPQNSCNAMYGDQIVVQDALRPARSGDSFLCTAEAVQTALPSAELVSSSHDHVHDLFAWVGRLMTSLTQSVIAAVRDFDAWTQNIDSLHKEIESTQARIVHVLRSVVSVNIVQHCQLDDQPLSSRALSNGLLGSDSTSPFGSDVQASQLVPPLPAPLPVQVPCPGFPVTIALDAVVPKVRTEPDQPLDDRLATLEWMHSENWKAQVVDSLDLRLGPIPPQLKMTPSTFNAVFAAMEGPIGPYELVEVFVDGATSPTAAS